MVNWLAPAALASLVSLAAGPQSLTDEPGQTGIYGGTELGVCEWPTVVSLGPYCNGVLIHPRVVLFTGTCGTEFDYVLFSETTYGGTAVATTVCEAKPTDRPLGYNFAYCVLEKSVDLAVVPVLMGCELNELQAGAPIVGIGYGQDNPGPLGFKRAANYEINSVLWDENYVKAGGNGKGICAGDNGAPHFLQMPDGTWRLFAMGSKLLQGCDDQAILALAHEAIPWVEERTGYDVTPCHDADGTWNPSFLCGGFPLEPGVGVGQWPTCGYGEVSDYSKTCGPAYGADADSAAPSVTITAPADMTQHEDAPLVQSVYIHADDGDGWGVARVWLEIDGEEVAGFEDTYPPYVAENLTFSAGTYEIVAFAEDHAGNRGVSALVELVVGPDEPDPGTTGSTGGDTTGDSEDPPETTDATGVTVDDGSCACRSDARDRAPGTLALGLWVLFARRRRSKHRSE